MSKSILSFLGAFAILTSAAVQANASLQITSSVGGQPLTGSGITYVTFDSLPLGNAGGVDSGITVSFAPDAEVVAGAASGLYAAPVISNGNGANFGQVDGVDTTRYLTSGKDASPNIGAATILSFTSHQNYFGLLWGSVDDYNTLSFYDGATLVGSLTGADVAFPANGDQGVNGTVYANIISTLPFNKVVATSSEYAFEFDNVAYGVVPEASTIAVWSVLGLIGFAAFKKRNEK